MSLFTASINSGSNGNCYYVGNHHEAVLIDVGISCREVVKRMQRMGLSIQKVKAIFVSHEHSDHVRGLRVLSSKYKIPVFVNEATIKSGMLYLDRELVNSFEHGCDISIGGLKIIPFKKQHDAADPYSFNIVGNGITVGVYTDIGCACENVINYFKECHAVFLEANYDEAMLENGPYPFYLKKRISSDNGHLSNTQALELFKKYKPSFLSHVFLAHLSKENNDPAMVLKLFEENAEGVVVAVASRYQESGVFEIKSNNISECLVINPVANKQPELNNARQISLF